MSTKIKDLMSKEQTERIFETESKPKLTYFETLRLEKNSLDKVLSLLYFIDLPSLQRDCNQGQR